MNAKDYRFRWVEDDDFDSSWADAEMLEYIQNDGVRGCILEVWNPAAGKGWEVVASLWGITESLVNAERDAYRRVIESDLLLEAGIEVKS